MSFEAVPLPETATWTIEVKVEQLGAHLQAYRERETARVSLQECVNQGRGSITRLPTELIDHVAEHLEHGRRVDHERSWGPRYSLSEMERGTDTLDYVRSRLQEGPDKETLLAILDWWTHEECPFCKKVYTEKDPAAKCTHCQAMITGQALFSDHPAAERLAFALFLRDDWLEVVYDIRDEWLLAIELGELICQEDQELLRKHFGVRAWIYHEPNNVFWIRSTIVKLFPVDLAGTESEAGKVLGDVLRKLDLEPMSDIEWAESAEARHGIKTDQSNDPASS